MITTLSGSPPVGLTCMEIPPSIQGLTCISMGGYSILACTESGNISVWNTANSKVMFNTGRKAGEGFHMVSVPRVLTFYRYLLR